jgi:hypothetical protein
MKSITTVFICFSFFYAVGQITIEEISYHSYCNEATYDLSIPVLRTEGQHRELIKLMNDSVQSVFAGLKDEVDPCIPEENDPEEDTEESNVEYEVGLRYTVYVQTNTLISIALTRSTALVGRGHGSERKPFCFNLDLSHNRAIDIDSLFDPPNKKKLEKFVRENRQRLEQEQEMSFLPLEAADIFNEKHIDGVYSYYRGMSLTDSDIMFYYQYYMGHGIYELDDFRLALQEIKPFINEQYQWLCDEL